MKAYSSDLRSRVIQAYDSGLGTAQHVAAVFNVSESFVRSLLRRRRRLGHIEAKPHGGGAQALLDPSMQDALRQYVLKFNDLTLAEYQTWIESQFAVKPSISAICRLLKKLKLTRKKKTFTRVSEIPSVSKPSESSTRN